MVITPDWRVRALCAGIGYPNAGTQRKRIGGKSPEDGTNEETIRQRHRDVAGSESTLAWIAAHCRAIALHYLLRVRIIALRPNQEHGRREARNHRIVRGVRGPRKRIVDRGRYVCI